MYHAFANSAKKTGHKRFFFSGGSCETFMSIRSAHFVYVQERAPWGTQAYRCMKRVLQTQSSTLLSWLWASLRMQKRWDCCGLLWECWSAKQVAFASERYHLSLILSSMKPHKAENVARMRCAEWHGEFVLERNGTLKQFLRKGVDFFKKPMNHANSQHL